MIGALGVLNIIEYIRLMVHQVGYCGSSVCNSFKTVKVEQRNLILKFKLNSQF